MKIKNARKTMRAAFKKDPDFKRTYVDNVAMYVYDNAPFRPDFFKEKDNRDEFAEEIIDLIFSE